MDLPLIWVAFEYFHLLFGFSVGSDYVLIATLENLGDLTYDIISIKSHGSSRTELSILLFVDIIIIKLAEVDVNLPQVVVVV